MDDSDIEAIIRRLRELGSEQQRLDYETEALWKTFFIIADQRAGRERPYRYLDVNSGYVIARQVTHQRQIDEAKLKSVVPHAVWLKITVPKRELDATLLEAALKQGKIAAEVVEGCVLHKSTTRRYGPRLASKEELVELETQEAQR